MQAITGEEGGAGRSCEKSVYDGGGGGGAGVAYDPVEVGMRAFLGLTRREELKREGKARDIKKVPSFSVGKKDGLVWFWFCCRFM